MHLVWTGDKRSVISLDDKKQDKRQPTQREENKKCWFVCFFLFCCCCFVFWLLFFSNDYDTGRTYMIYHKIKRCPLCRTSIKSNILSFIDVIIAHQIAIANQIIISIGMSYIMSYRPIHLSVRWIAWLLLRAEFF